MKKILLMVVIAGLFASAASAAGKVAVVDTQTVFDKTQLGKKYQGIIREHYESRKKILDMDMEDLQKLQEDYAKQKQGKTLTEKAEREIEENINRRYNEVKKKQAEFSAELGKKQDELFKDFNQVLMLVVKDIAKKEKFEMILNKVVDPAPQAGLAPTPIVLYAEDGLDITDKVIAAMDSRK